MPRHHQNCPPPYRSIVRDSQAHRLIQTSNLFHLVRNTTRHTFFSVIAACTLVTSIVGCGSPASDPMPNVNSRSTITQDLANGVQKQDVGASPDETQDGQHNRPVSDQSPRTANERHSSPALSVPNTIVKDLDSSNPRTRYDALDYWQTTGTQAPLDLVFEAMEDEDATVREKATAIIEHYWEAEDERERG